MRQFKVRDLMINLLPEGGQLPFCRGVTLPDCAFTTEHFVGCAVTICPSITRCFQVTYLAAPCDADGGSSCNACMTIDGVRTGGCAPGTGGKLVQDTGRHLQELGILKEQLKQSLVQVEAQERAFAESLQPQTLDELQQLEDKLTGALEELRARRGEIERNTPKTEK